jgi:predicted metal-binding membrane protein
MISRSGRWHVRSPAAQQRRKVRRPLLVFTAVIWLAIVLLDPMGSGGPLHHSTMNMTMSGMSNSSMSGMSMTSSTSGNTSLALFWMSSLMTMAMMGPLLIAPLRYLGDRSLPQRRPRARLLFLAPCCALWILGGLALQEIAALLGRSGLILAAAAVFAAVVWQLSPVKQECLNGHHRRPSLAAFGHAADEDALKFGVSHGLWCFGSCWALMLLPIVLGSAQLAVMAPVSLWIWAEQFDQPAKASWQIHVPMTGVRVVTYALSKVTIRTGTSRIATPAQRIGAAA